MVALFKEKEDDGTNYHVVATKREWERRLLKGEDRRGITVEEASNVLYSNLYVQLDW